MRLHSFEHVPFEDLAQIGVWSREQGHCVSRTRFYAADPVPLWSDFDWLVVMGGPMNIYEEDRYPWLAQEKACISEAIAHGRLVLGICLGAQLIADVLGGPVTQNAYKEIGWFPVTLTTAASTSPIFHDFPSEFMAFHWHGDTFAVPPGAQAMATSVACAQQAFTYTNKVVALQFHLESTPTSVRKLIDHCGAELKDGPYIQTAAEMLNQEHFFLDIGKNMTRLLNNLAAQYE
ncbi:MAG: type 1 glutamine amidotransferase [Desulfobacca sp.]|uniref:type 1 glutamine amidotransferase n=1 Tax=Desulfobacca sp. TaxID=2067990 RepID=UPI00404AA19C